MCLRAGVEANVCHRNTKPAHETGYRGHVGKPGIFEWVERAYSEKRYYIPGEHFTSATANRHISKQTEQRVGSERYVRKTPSIHPTEDFRGVTVERQAICSQVCQRHLRHNANYQLTESAGTAIQVTRCSRPCRGKETSVDQGWQALDACMSDGNDEWRLRRVGLLKAEIWVRIGHKETDDRDASDIEQQDTNIDTLDCLGNVTAWILRFTTSDGYNFRTNERESSLGHDSPPGKEAAFATRDPIVLYKRTRMFPVTEADTIVVRTATEIEHDTKNDKAGDRDYLD